MPAACTAPKQPYQAQCCAPCGPKWTHRPKGQARFVPQRLDAPPGERHCMVLNVLVAILGVRPHKDACSCGCISRRKAEKGCHEPKHSWEGQPSKRKRESKAGCLSTEATRARDVSEPTAASVALLLFSWHPRPHLTSHICEELVQPICPNGDGHGRLLQRQVQVLGAAQVDCDSAAKHQLFRASKVGRAAGTSGGGVGIGGRRSDARGGGPQQAANGL